MSRIFSATCSAAGIVKVEDLAVEAVILSEGKAASTGVVVLDDENATYLTSNASDIKALITSLVAIIQSQITILTALDAGAPAPNTQAAAIASLLTLKTQLNLTKDNLK